MEKKHRWEPGERVLAVCTGAWHYGVGVVRSGPDKNNRYVALLPHGFAYFETVQVRHHHVQHQQVERLLLCQHERLFAVIRRCHRHARRPKEILHQRG